MLNETRGLSILPCYFCFNIHREVILFLELNIWKMEMIKSVLIPKGVSIVDLDFYVKSGGIKILSTC